MRQFVIFTPNGSVKIPVNNLLPYLQEGIPITFILNKRKRKIEVLVNGSVIRLSGAHIVQNLAVHEAPETRQAKAEALQQAAEQQKAPQAEAEALQQAAEQEWFGDDNVQFLNKQEKFYNFYPHLRGFSF